MENKMHQLFDLQRFEKNPRMQAVIDASHKRRNIRQLSDDELSLVAAAGAIYENNNINNHNVIS